MQEQNKRPLQSGLVNLPLLLRILQRLSSLEEKPVLTGAARPFLPAPASALSPHSSHPPPDGHTPASGPSHVLFLLPKRSLSDICMAPTLFSSVSAFTSLCSRGIL